MRDVAVDRSQKNTITDLQGGQHDK
jgi:hypothetical protein